MSLLIKAQTIFEAYGVDYAYLFLTNFMPWVLVLGTGLLAIFAISYIIAKKINTPLASLLTKMDEVEAGQFDNFYDWTTISEFDRLIQGYNDMIGGLKERELIKQK